MKTKNYLWSMLAFVMAAVVSVGLSSCGDDPELNIDEKERSVELDASGAQKNITVRAIETDWSVEVINGLEWLTARKNGDNLIIFANKNTETEDRTGMIVVTATEATKLSIPVTVVQKGATAFITVNGSSKAEHKFPGLFKNGKSGIDFKVEFKIKSNVEWNLSGEVDWLNISTKYGNGEVNLTIYPTSENPSSEVRTATLTLSGEGAAPAEIMLIQDGGPSAVKVKPINLVALYDQIGWELEAVGKVNKFQYLILTEGVYTYKTEKEILADLQSDDPMKYADEYMFFPRSDSYGNDIKANNTYYICTVAYDENDNMGEIVKTKITTPKYLNENDDAWVSIDDATYNLNTGFWFTATKQGYCDTFHTIYGCLPSGYNYSRVAFVFEINYYIKNKKKHWFANNWNMEIVTNYPNTHTFNYSTTLLSSRPLINICTWGVFKDGKESSDALLVSGDISQNNARMRKISHEEESKQNLIIRRSVEERRAREFFNR